MVGDLDAVEILLIQSRKKLGLSLRAVIRGNVWRLDKLSCAYPDLTAAEQKQEAENSSTNKTASSDTLHHGGTSCRHGTISLKWSRNDEIQLAAALFIFYDTMI